MSNDERARNILKPYLAVSKDKYLSINDKGTGITRWKRWATKPKLLQRFKNWLKR